jgi:hypothetical protein
MLHLKNFLHGPVVISLLQRTPLPVASRPVVEKQNVKLEPP